ncbi:hypothetical protein ACFSKU_02330 [Pontibacter silvestris]|uniref:DUF429 domain-containing protein n=1 Tax=Pontibacter silvestris TaxID=2305183 RepID=A0ABW4WSG7_9BACT|nr:hypothetical protein [Pontibacter silvestris]MCC9137768.1 hypothetical protein [Pontibacter silvestris]
MPEQFLHMGLDYGSQLAGTTAAAMLVEGQVQIWQSKKGQNADDWLLNLVQEVKPKLIYIDAPLTLPAVYSQTPLTVKADFFYRVCDREVKAMSPMIIGGLTARAIKLRTQLATAGVATLETYPTQLKHLLFPHLENYKKDLKYLTEFTEALEGMINFKINIPPANWHQLDAMLAWYSGCRHLQKQSVLYGDATEGRIIV